MVVTVGIQGPPGPTDCGQARISRVAGESLAAYAVVAVASDGKVYRASKSTPEHINRVLGITLAAAAADAAVDVHLFGEVVNGAWSFDTTKLIWLGDGGALTQSAPTSGFVMVMGYPTSSGSMFVIPGACAILASVGAGDAGKVVALDSAGKLALSLLPSTLTGKDADSVDGYHAGNAAGKVPVLDGSALLPLAQVPATLIGKNADMVDGCHVGTSANNIPALDGNAILPLTRTTTNGDGGDNALINLQGSTAAALRLTTAGGSGTTVALRAANGEGVYIDINAVMCFVFNRAGNYGLRTADFGGGVGVIGIATASTVPNSNPSGGVVLYLDTDGKLKYRTPSGEVRTISYT